MAARSLTFTADAQADLTEAFSWYLARSPRAAARLLAEVERAATLISETPAVWPAFDADTRRYVLHGFPYSIVYRVAGIVIQVIAITHHKRRPGASRP